METEFIYEADLSTFAQAPADGAQTVEVPATIGGEGQHDDNGEIQVQSEEVESQEVIADPEATGTLCAFTCFRLIFASSTCLLILLTTGQQDSKI